MDVPFHTNSINRLLEFLFKIVLKISHTNTFTFLAIFRIESVDIIDMSRDKKYLSSNLFLQKTIKRFI